MTGDLLDPAYVAAVLDRSAERAAWLRRVLAAEIRGYDRGDLNGYRRGREDECAEWVRSLEPARRAAADAARYPSHAELERRRWGPAGREHFGDPQPGDFKGRGR